MDVALVIARLLLALVFAVAAMAKLADRTSSRQAIVDFGVPGRVAAPFAFLLPLAEVAVALALIPNATAWWGALGALALLLVFTGAIAVNLARGRKPDCRCFGQLSSSPVGWRTLARNGILAIVAGFVLWQGREDPGRSTVSWVGGLTTAELVAAVAAAVALGVLAVLGWLVLNLVRQQGRLLVRLEALETRLGGERIEPADEAPPERGLPVGSPAPGFQLTGLYGETLTLDALRAAGKPVLLVFADPNCGPCNALLPSVAQWQRGYAAELTLAVVTRGSADENRPKVTEHGLANVLLQRDREVAEAYGEEGTPCAVVVGSDGTIQSPLAAGADAIEALVARAVGSSRAVPTLSSPGAPPPLPAQPAQPSGNNGSAPPAPSVGEPAPPLRLPDVNGRTINLTGYRGAKTLVLFWNPGCGFCQQMLDELRAWDANPPEGAPKLLVASTGSGEENRAMGLRSPVLHDHDSSVASSFGANGTPMAVLVDEEGRIASDVAAGAPAVMALARGEPAPPPDAPPPPAAKVGDPAPAVQLPDLSGTMHSLADFRGNSTLVLFWNPGCGFCQQMLDELKAWETDRPDDAPTVVIVSTGSVEDNRAMGLRSPVLLDQNFGVGSAFGANGTPMAVLVDEDGRIASEVAAGAPAVMALARGDATDASAA